MIDTCPKCGTEASLIKVTSYIPGITKHLDYSCWRCHHEFSRISPFFSFLSDILLSSFFFGGIAGEIRESSHDELLKNYFAMFFLFILAGGLWAMFSLEAIGRIRAMRFGSRLTGLEYQRNPSKTVSILFNLVFPLIFLLLNFILVWYIFASDFI